MSSSLAYAPLRRPPLHSPVQPRLTPAIEVVPDRAQRRARPRVAYAVIVVSGLMAILLSQLMLSIGLSNGAYAIDSLEQQRNENDRTEQLLREQLDALSSPQNLARNAEALGMVQNANPVWLSVATGEVIGTPKAAKAGMAAGNAAVANELLGDVPLVTQLENEPAASAAAGSSEAAVIATRSDSSDSSDSSDQTDGSGASAPNPEPAVAQVALPSEIPSPVTR